MKSKSVFHDLMGADQALEIICFEKHYNSVLTVAKRTTARCVDLPAWRRWLACWSMLRRMFFDGIVTAVHGIRPENVTKKTFSLWLYKSVDCVQLGQVCECRGDTPMAGEDAAVLCVDHCCHRHRLERKHELIVHLQPCSRRKHMEMGSPEYDGGHKGG